VVTETDGPRIADLDGNWSYDLGGSYGVNLFGSEFYKRCIERGVARAGQLGLVLGSYHPVVVDNVRRLREISQLDEVSFHMSGTEAVMQAVRLARYHTGRSHVVRFCGAYHGWWDGVQAGVGNPRPPHELYTLEEMDDTTLRVLDTRNNIACVLVNPIQALHPNGAPASDSTLLAGDRKAHYDKAAYTEWLRQLREVCTRRGIVLVFDEVFLGFRLARGGVQEYFGVPADLVTYGKSLGGGLPVGVVCGKRAYMRRFRDDNPSDVCLARGTFNSHPYVMATMNEFLRALDEPEIARTYEGLDERWNGRAEALNRALAQGDLPVRVANLTSVMTTLYQVPSRYNWMFQYYLRAEGLALSWVGSGRFIFPHDTSDATFQAVSERFVAAARAMQRDEFWWHPTDLTNRSIKRRVLLELVSAGLARRASDPATPP
jgi:glutamate-1-semialdehyde 2,1-aminomutase